jgi:hypothetical protein
MVVSTSMPPVLARLTRRADQIVITAGGARRMRAVGGILIAAAEVRG